MQQHPLLQTKLHIPPVRPELVSRLRLIERLEAGLDRRLTLVSAPAGFGKTTLLSECAARCRSSVAWLSLDERDNSPTRFWIYVITALQTLYDGVGTIVLEALQMPRALPNETLLGQLINQIADIPEPLALILDDLHVITDPQIHEQLSFLVEHAPAQMHLVVSSRADPLAPATLVGALLFPGSPPLITRNWDDSSPTCWIYCGRGRGPRIGLLL